MSSPDPPRVFPDWQDVWRHQMTEHLAACPGFAKLNRQPGDVIDPSFRRLLKTDADRRIGHMVIPDGARLLDIGEGLGLLAPRLLQKGCQLTIIDPSQALSAVLKGCAGAPPFTLLEGSWADISDDQLDPPYDLVIAPHSLWDPEIRKSVLRMESLCRGYIYLSWFLTPPPDAVLMEDLWERIHGVRFPQIPRADCLYQILLGTGIVANLNTDLLASGIRYANIGQAKGDFTRRMGCTSREHEDLVRQYLQTHLTMDATGFRLRGSWWDATISWKARNK
jgi:hypothetical protein